MVEKVFNTKETSHYLRVFESFKNNGARKSPDWLNAIRLEAINRFSQLGFPTMRDEFWKYTNVNPIREISFQLDHGREAQKFGQDDLRPFLFGEVGWPRLVFVNGLYSEKLSLLPKVKEPSFVGSLNRALHANSPFLREHLAHYASFEQNAFTALNTALVQDGALVYLAAGHRMDEPLHLLLVSTASGEDIVSNPRNLIVLGSQAGCCVIESYVSLGTHKKCFTNAVTEIVLNESTALEHHKFLRAGSNHYHIATTQVTQKASSAFISFSIALGTLLARNNLNVILDGEDARCTLNGLYYVEGEEHIDNHTWIDHPRPRGTSRQLYKGLVSGRGSAVFGGKIFVHEGAQKRDGEQTNQNLLLSKQATVDTKPQLEIFADDVKCAHGAAVGQLEEKSLFYLKSRGISAEEARKILCYGFANEIIERIQIASFKAYLGELFSNVWSKLQETRFSDD